MATEGSRSARLYVDGHDDAIELPVLQPSLGNDVIDIGALTRKGYFTYDPGFVSTASCDSNITYIDGDAGVLLHRGYPIEQLAEQSDFLELCYLLLHGGLPSATQKDAFVAAIAAEREVPAGVRAMLGHFSPGAHPMGIMTALAGALAAEYHDGLDIANEQHRLATALRVIAQMPGLAALTYRHGKGLPYIPPRDDLGYAENFLYTTFATDENYAINPVIARAMDRIFMLHADHEQNASTSTVRLAGSTGTNPYSAIAAGIAALWGPSHGGANEAVLNMLAEIGTPENIDKYVAKAKDRDDPFRIMGFGHRVYKSYDPRATVMQADLPRSACRAGRGRRPAVADGHAPRADCPGGRVLHRAAPVSERGLLLRHHLEGPGHPHRDVHGHLHHRPHARLDRALARDGQRALQDRPPPPALPRRDCAGIRAFGEALARRQPTALDGQLPQPGNRRQQRESKARRRPERRRCRSQERRQEEEGHAPGGDVANEAHAGPSRRRRRHRERHVRPEYESGVEDDVDHEHEARRVAESTPSSAKQQKEDRSHHYQEGQREDADRRAAPKQHLAHVHGGC